VLVRVADHELECHDARESVQRDDQRRRALPTRRSCCIAIGDADRPPTAVLRGNAPTALHPDRSSSSTGHDQRRNDPPEHLHVTIVAVDILGCTSRGCKGRDRRRCKHTSSRMTTTSRC
jgi:hypothetical protein